MAEDVLDKVLGDGHPKCNTLDTVLHGGEGYSESLSVVLIQKYGVLEDVAEVRFRAPPLSSVDVLPSQA